MSEQYELFRDLVQQLAVLDCLFSLTAVACQPGYIKPEFVADRTQIKVISGRHPMVEQILTGPFVPNDVDFNVSAAEDSSCFWVVRGCSGRSENDDIDGPKYGRQVSSKSSYIRQVALLSIMGQIGSYVPAESAKLGILDAVFTR
ncbi:hypothetical protein BC937DRAFT_95004 [Endogone sp. FLAS-F59071]|nr:hypothetical protein BC937DRAFT_95004 [Endogone sp. FLAS-F59071]|eukprot:RUS20533.1 hypothetical protein BC937DRAFT_95004 [Endogone sp. FLAS-F59071]